MAAGAFSSAVMHTPVDVTDNAVAAATGAGADCLVAIGGGSTIGLAKAIALRTDLPQVAIPTTYAGSEMTDILGETKDGAKTTVRTLKVLPETVIYDVELTLGLPVSVSSTSGMNARHAVEALYALDETGRQSDGGGQALANAFGDQGITARCRSKNLAQLGAGRGICLGSAAMALHKICRVLGKPQSAACRDTYRDAAARGELQCRFSAGSDGHRCRALRRERRHGLHRLKEELVGLSLADLGMPFSGIDGQPAASLLSQSQTDRAQCDPWQSRRLVGRTRSVTEGIPKANGQSGIEARFSKAV
jgi:hypothetical protein